MPAVVISPDEYGALESLGAFQRILDPGVYPLWPWQKCRKISSRVQENRCVTETKTKDNVFVKVHIAVQQEVHRERCMEAIYRLNNPDQQIDSYVSDIVRSHAPKVTLDELFAAKEEIALEVKQTLTEAMANYGYVMRQVLVVDIDPDQLVKSAMNQINANKRLRQAAEEKAEADKVVIVKAAEAEAMSKFLQGQGVARSRAAIVQGLRDSISGGGAQMKPKEITELLLMTQYMDTLEKLGQGQNTTVFMPHSVGGLSEISEQIKKGVLGAT